MSLSSPVSIEIDAPDLAALAEAVLARTYGAPAEGGAGEWLVGVLATGSGPRALLAAVVAEVEAIAQEEATGVVSCSVSGAIATDDGQRAWGYVALGGKARERIAPAIVAVEQRGAGWRAVLAEGAS